MQRNRLLPEDEGQPGRGSKMARITGQSIRKIDEPVEGGSSREPESFPDPGPRPHKGLPQILRWGLALVPERHRGATPSQPSRYPDLVADLRPGTEDG